MLNCSWTYQLNPSQSNNAYIFPGFGLGLVISGAIRVHDDMLLAACKLQTFLMLSYKSYLAATFSFIRFSRLFSSILTFRLTETSCKIAEALAEQVTEENFQKGLIFPPFTNIRKISAHIAAKVAAKVYELGMFHLLYPLKKKNNNEIILARSTCPKISHWENKKTKASLLKKYEAF